MKERGTVTLGAAAHRQLLARIRRYLSPRERDVTVALLREISARTKGVEVYLCGSHVSGLADRYSDIDLLVIASPRTCHRLWRSKAALLGTIGRIGVLVDLYPLVPWSVIACYADGTRIHVSFRSGQAWRLEPDFVHRHRLTRRVAGVEKTTESEICGQTCDPVQLLRRTGYWLISGSARCARGELWTSHDTLHDARRLLVECVSTRLGLKLWGFRRIECSRFPVGVLRAIQSSVGGIERPALARGYRRLTRVFASECRRFRRKYGPAVRSDLGAFVQHAVAQFLTGLDSSKRAKTK